MAGNMTPSVTPDKTRSAIRRLMSILAAVGVNRDITDDTRMQPPYNHLPP